MTISPLFKKLSVFFGLPGVTLILLNACSPQGDEPLAEVRFGIARQPSSALVHIALARGYFEQEGLKVRAEFFPSGKRALVDGLLEDRVDYITTADIPFVWKSFIHDDLVLLACLYTADNVNRLVARRDAGIKDLHDLKGKRIATQKQSAVHYFLHLLLIEQAIAHDAVQLSYYKAERLPEKLAAGEIDAFTMREPYISQAVERLGADNAIVFEQPGLYVQNDMLVTRRAHALANESVSQALLRALVKAEGFARNHPQQAIGLVARALDADPGRIEALWGSFDLHVRIEHALLPRLEHQARWLMEEGLVTAEAIPDFRTRIHRASLSRVKPEAMLLIQ